jgi:hypothetical protein
MATWEVSYGFMDHIVERNFFVDTLRDLLFVLIKLPTLACPHSREPWYCC